MGKSGKPGLLKAVPAKVGDVAIGEALLYDDHTVEIVIFKDADPAAIAIFEETAKDFRELGKELKISGFSGQVEGGQDS